MVYTFHKYNKMIKVNEKMQINLYILENLLFDFKIFSMDLYVGTTIIPIYIYHVDGTYNIIAFFL